MSNELRFREASKSDLPDVLRLYAQPDLDDVGTFALLIMDNLGHLGTPSAIIEDVAVDPTLQGQGIGRQMRRHALQLAAANGCYKAALSSNLKRSRAHAFYESLDFERHGFSFRIDL